MKKNQSQFYFIKKKFYLSDKGDLINLINTKLFKSSLYFGKKENFKIFYDNLKKISFPINQIKKYTSAVK